MMMMMTKKNTKRLARGSRPGTFGTLGLLRPVCDSLPYKRRGGWMWVGRVGDSIGGVDARSALGMDGLFQVSSAGGVGATGEGSGRRCSPEWLGLALV
jgi:hypothetical protein